MARREERGDNKGRRRNTVASRIGHPERRRPGYVSPGKRIRSVGRAVREAGLSRLEEYGFAEARFLDDREREGR